MLCHKYEYTGEIVTFRLMVIQHFICTDFTKSSECQEALGMQNGAITDAQISASSEWDSKHAAAQGRLDFRAVKRKSGSWSAGKNNKNQWLQVYLGSQLTEVTGVATQGRSDYDQWVTKYKLFYSYNGVQFLVYRTKVKET